MAPEQFHGKAVFASDIYSLGVTMYQMLTGTLPYDTPAPADLGKLMSGELVSNPRLLNPAIPRAISDIILRAMAPEVTQRYQRASELLEDVLAARMPPASRRTPPAISSVTPEPAGRVPREQGSVRDRGDEPAAVQRRLHQREPPGARFCWQCRKPLHARTDRCPFCGEAQ
jgi:serine/threonine-protein kinase